jgi:LacI family transcriptional regulator
LGIEMDGLFAISDLTAAGAIRFFQKVKLRVPEDIAVVGFSNWQLSTLTTPTLSTVDQSGFLMGEEVIRLFLNQMEQRRKKEEITYNTSIVPSKLIVRESSKKKKRIYK